jgi:hypothetical protein
MELEQALALVKAAGFRISKPRAPKAESQRGPTCVVQFADGEICRMTTYSPKALDYDRGIRQCQAAWLLRLTGTAMGDLTQTPPVKSCHFERDGHVIARYGEAMAA